MPDQPQKFYLTTPIYYVNARPHIGHAYTTIVADVLARRHRLLGDPTFFLTGTDEHGQKIERSAAAAGIPPQQFADEVAAAFQTLWQRMGITNNKFIRTTDPAHAHGAQHLFAELYKRGHIYLSSYTGAYCVSDEAFVDAPVGTPCPDCGRTLEEVTEENFFFRLSTFQQPLLELIESGTLKIEPESRRNEVHMFLTGNVRDTAKAHGATPIVEFQDRSGVLGLIPESAFEQGHLKRTAFEAPFVPNSLRDLSVSRSSFTWGIPVPAEVQRDANAKDNHVIYVWLDALANYMTAVGYGAATDPTLTADQRTAAEAEFRNWWPADLHLVGKEIIRFHCVYWPAFLLALNPALQQPRQEEAPGGPFMRSPTAHEWGTSSEPPQLTQLPFEQHKAWAAQWLPKAITAHGWLLFENSKMSKSKGNIVRTETILDAFGEHVYAKQFPDSTKHERDLFAADVLRYFLLREIPFGQDGSFSFEALITRYNADLANGYGNLVSRTLVQISRSVSAVIPTSHPHGFARIVRNAPGEMMTVKWTLGVNEDILPDHFWDAAPSLEQLVRKLFDQYEFHLALEAIWEAITAVDNYLTGSSPWKLSESDPEQAASRQQILYTAAEAIRIITALLYPILPYATARVWSQLGLGDIERAAREGKLTNLQWGGLQPGTKLGPLAPIFPRADKGLAQIMTDMEEANASRTSNLASPDRPAAPLKAALTPTPSAPIPSDPNDPAAPPRALDGPTGTLPVAGSQATTTGPDATPPHTAAHPSGPFATAASQVPITAAPIPAGANTPADASPQITIDDFAKIELRVAEIKVVERIPKADKLLRLEVDLGHETRQILSGIAEHYTPEDLVGRRIVVITNLAPRKMRGLDSHGMLLAASEDAGPEGKPGKPILATVPEGVPLGSRLK